MSAEIDAEDAPAVLPDEDADLAGAATDFDDRIADRLRERREQLTIERLVAQLIEKACLVLRRNGVVRRTELLPCHPGIFVQVPVNTTERWCRPDSGSSLK